VLLVTGSRPHSSMLHSSMLHSSMLHSSMLHSSMLHSSILHWALLAHDCHAWHARIAHVAPSNSTTFRQPPLVCVRERAFRSTNAHVR
jgi:hypothetical protein